MSGEEDGDLWTSLFQSQKRELEDLGFLRSSINLDRKASFHLFSDAEGRREKGSLEEGLEAAMNPAFLWMRGLIL